MQRQCREVLSNTGVKKPKLLKRKTLRLDSFFYGGSVWLEILDVFLFSECNFLG